jgi:hypothetical protein
MTPTPVLLARVRYVGSRVGAIGWAGLAGALLALLLVAAARLNVDPANHEAADHIADLRARFDRASLPGAALRDPADAMAAVAAQLPAADQAPGFIQDVQAGAARDGVRIDRTEYRIQSALGGRAQQLQLVMPAHGTYPQLRTWLQALLSGHPSAALDELALHRETDGAAQLEARVMLTFYTRAVR